VSFSVVHFVLAFPQRERERIDFDTVANMPSDGFCQVDYKAELVVEKKNCEV
jgi:hypothetical protein